MLFELQNLPVCGLSKPVLVDLGGVLAFLIPAASSPPLDVLQGSAVKCCHSVLFIGLLDFPQLLVQQNCPRLDDHILHPLGMALGQLENVLDFL